VVYVRTVGRNRAYEANLHIFEDEAEALTAFGVVPIRTLAAIAA
jgi:hypothetical protein